MTTERVLILSSEHLLPIALAIVLAVVFFKHAQTKSLKLQQGYIHVFAIGIALVVIGFHLFKISTTNYDVRTDLPLYLCSLLGILIPIYTYFKKYWMFEILVFWTIAGTLQGVLTPDIAEGFPSLDYFRYWVVHLGLLIVIFYHIIVFKLKPKLKSVFKSFLALQVYVLLMVAINYCLDANYFYLNQKPDSASLLDYFGEWPLYIGVAQIIVIPLFLLIYMPFHLHYRRVQKGLN